MYRQGRRWQCVGVDGKQLWCLWKKDWDGGCGGAQGIKSEAFQKIINIVVAKIYVKENCQNT